MPNFNKINDLTEIPAGWNVSTRFDEKIVDEEGFIPQSDYKGHRYRLMKIEREYDGLERFGRGLLGIAAAIARCFMCSYISSRTVEKLFTKEMKTERIGLLLKDDNAVLQEDESSESVDNTLLESNAARNREILVSLFDRLEKINANMAEQMFSDSEFIELLIQNNERVIPAEAVDGVEKFFEEKRKETIDKEIAKEKAKNKLKNAAINEEMLTKLYDKLEKVSPEIAEQIFGDQGLMKSLIAENELVITDQDIETFVNIAQSSRGAEEGSHESGLDLSKVEGSLIQGLPANIETIKQAFPEVDVMLKVLPKQHPMRKDFDLLMKQSMLLQSIKNPTKFSPSTEELAIFKAMGLDFSLLDGRKAEFFKKLREVLKSPEFQELDFDKFDFDQLQNAIWEQQFYIKFSQVGGKEEGKKILIPLYKFRNELKAEIKNGVPEAKLFIGAHPEVEKYPIAQNFIKNCLNEIIDSQLDDELSRAINSIYKGLKKALSEDSNLDVENYLKERKSKLTKQCSNASERIVGVCNVLIDKSLAWYKQWGNYLVKEMIQGSEDANEVLGGGVCHAISTRLCVTDQGNPDASLEELASHMVIKPIDRFNQASYMMNYFIQGKIKSNVNYPLDYASRNGIEEAKSIFAHTCKTFDPKWLEDPEVAADLRQSNGIFELGITKHAVYLRVDEEKKIYHFFDSNIGLVGDFSDLATMVKCFNDHMESIYPENNRMSGTVFTLRD